MTILNTHNSHPHSHSTVVEAAEAEGIEAILFHDLRHQRKTGGADDEEAITTAAATAGAAEDNDNEPASSSATSSSRTTFTALPHRFQQPNSLTPTQLWSKNHRRRLWLRLLSFVSILILITFGGYKYRQRQKQSALLAALPKDEEVVPSEKKEEKKKGKAPKSKDVSSSEPSASPSLSRSPSASPSDNPSVSSVPSSSPSDNPSVSSVPSSSPSDIPSVSSSSVPSTDICTPLPFGDGIYIKEGGDIVLLDSTTVPQCSKIGDWDPSTGNIEIDDDEVSDDPAKLAALIVRGMNGSGYGTNSKKVVVRSQTFDANNIPGLDQNSYGVQISQGASVSFCSSTFLAKGAREGVYNLGTTLNIVNSTLKGGPYMSGLGVLAGTTTIVGTNTSIVGAYLQTQGIGIDAPKPVLIIYGGTFEGPVERKYGYLYVWGGEFKGGISNEFPTEGIEIRYIGPQPYRANNVNTLCDGSAMPTISGEIAYPYVRYVPCPCAQQGGRPYEVPTFSECE